MSWTKLLPPGKPKIHKNILGPGFTRIGIICILPHKVSVFADIEFQKYEMFLCARKYSLIAQKVCMSFPWITL